MPRQGVPRLALPRLPLPIACPGPGGASLRVQRAPQPQHSRPNQVRESQEASARNGKAQGGPERGWVPEPFPAGCLPTAGDTRYAGS
jgi:hypothetical protein